VQFARVYWPAISFAPARCSTSSEISRPAKAAPCRHGHHPLVDAVRVAGTLNVMTSKEAEDAGVDETQRRRYFRRDNGKTTLQAPAENADWYYLESVDLENSTDTEQGDSVGVVTPWEFPEVELPVMTQARILELWEGMKIDLDLWRSDTRAEKWVGNELAKVLGMPERLDGKQKATVAKLVKNGIEEGWLQLYPRTDKHGHRKTYVKPGQLPAVK
jgi:hypothetical protein